VKSIHNIRKFANVDELAKKITASAGGKLGRGSFEVAALHAQARVNG
jgi:hypothetical protein